MKFEICAQNTKLVRKIEISVDVESVVNLLYLFFPEIFSIELKEQKDLSNSCLKCIDLTTKLAKVNKQFF